MRLARIVPAALLALLGAIASGCSSSSDPSSTTAPTQTIATDVLTGIVQPPVDNVLQTSFGTFTVGQGGGSVMITLTSAVETLPGGTLLPTVTMGLGVGTVTGATCSLLTNAFTTAQAGSAAQLTGTLSAGPYCVQVSDITSQLGPVSYAVAVAHP